MSFSGSDFTDEEIASIDQAWNAESQSSPRGIEDLLVLHLKRTYPFMDFDSPSPSPRPEDIEVISLDGAEKLTVLFQPPQQVEKVIEEIVLEGDDEGSDNQLKFQPMVEVDLDGDGEVVFLGYFDREKYRYIYIPVPAPVKDQVNSDITDPDQVSSDIADPDQVSSDIADPDQGNANIAQPLNAVATVVADFQIVADICDDADSYLADESDASTSTADKLRYFKRKVFKRRIAGSEKRSVTFSLPAPATTVKIPKHQLRKLKSAPPLFVYHPTRPHYSGAGMYGKNLLCLPGYKEHLEKQKENKRKAKDETIVPRRSGRVRKLPLKLTFSV